MYKPLVVRIRAILMMIVVIMVVMPFSTSALAQTPDAEIQPPVETPTEIATDVPPPPVETETQVPLPVETPTETATEIVPPTNEPMLPTATLVPPADLTPTGTSPDPNTGTPASDEQFTSPTATSEITVPDHLIVVGESEVTIGPGEVRDITVRYTLGSDRASTDIAVELTAPGGDSREGWTIAPLNRADTLEDPNDPSREYTARVAVADVTANGDVVDTTWRVTAPAHIETSISLRLSFASIVHEPVGQSTAVTAPNLVSILGVASVHAPTINCVAGAPNAWNCTFDTTHPGSITMDVSAAVPTGWELKLNGLPLGETAVALDQETVLNGSFVLSAEYPVGCPDLNGAPTFASLSVAFQFPSGDVNMLTSELPLSTERPEPKLTVESLEFDSLNPFESLTTTGRLTMTYADAPCAWQASVDLSDLSSENLEALDVSIVVTGVDGIEFANLTQSDRTITIFSPADTKASPSGEIVVHLQLELPHAVAPGSYVIKVITEISWKDVP